MSEHREWLSGFDKQHLKSWNDQLNANPEAALFEAAVRDVLQGFGHLVEPQLDLKSQGSTGAARSPDFRCSKSNEDFYVEVANILIAKATELTNLPHPVQLGTFSAHRKLTKAVFAKVQGKTTQCEQDLPTLLAVGTFHTAASCYALDRRCANSLLTGEPMITWDVDARTGASVGDTYQSMNLKYASFVRPGDSSIINARASISGILLCGFGVHPVSIIGVLHPEALRPFRTQLLPQIPFGDVRIDSDRKQLTTIWSDE